MTELSDDKADERKKNNTQKTEQKQKGFRLRRQTLIILFIVGMIINNEHKLCRAFDRLLKSETP